MKKLTFVLSILLLAGAARGDDAADKRTAGWREFRDRLATDKSLIRYYTFEEAGDVVPNIGGDKRGEFIVSLQESYFNADLHPGQNTDYTGWTEGRFAGKPALSFGAARDSATRSMFYGTPSGVLTLEAWVRPYANDGGKAEAILFSVGSGFGDGWILKATSDITYLRIGRPKKDGGDVELSVKPLAGHVWHQVVAVIEHQTLRLYVDGELAGTKEFTGGFTQPSAPGGHFAQCPEEARGGLKIGSIRNPDNTLRFDCDELALYNCALAPEDIRAHFVAGQPAESAADQVVAHRSLLEKQAQMDKIKIEIPAGSFGYFPAGKPVALTVGVPAAVKLASPLAVEVKICGTDGKPRFEGKKRLALAGGKEASLRWEVPFPATCGLYQMDILLKDSTGAVIANKNYPVAATVPVSPMSERPVSSPMAGHEILSLHNEDLAIGGRTERIIPYVPKLPDGGPDLRDLDARVSKILSLGLDLMVCVGPYYAPGVAGSFDPAGFEAWVRPIIERYKGKVKYWEIINEPNALKITPPQYVAYLKAAHRVIREVDPESKIVGLCGVGAYPEWTDDVLAAGGSGLFDILGFHNYIFSSPISGWKREHKIERVRAVLTKHLGKEIPIWNTESGIHQPRRAGGRPLNDAELLAKYPRGGQAAGITLVPADAIAMATEHVGAVWQTQSILLDCALGVERWFVLMGASNLYPQPPQFSGVPTEKGIAYAALASVLSPMKSTHLIPMDSSTAAGVLVTSLEGRHTAALFADIPTSNSFAVKKNGTYRGMDFLGNPLKWEAKDKLLTVSFGAEPVYIFDVPDDLHAAPILKVKSFPALLSPGAAAEGIVTITNLFSSALTAELSIASEKSTVSFSKDIHLEPGKSLDVPFRMIAGTLPRGDHALTLTLSQQGKEITATEQPFASEGVAQGVPMAAHAIHLNGDLSEWQDIPEETSDTASHLAIGRPPVGYYDASAWQGPKDLSFSVKTAWRPDDGIYFLLTVTDDKIQTAPPEQIDRAFLQDALEFFFDGRSLKDQAPLYSFGAEQTFVVPSVGDSLQPCAVKSLARYGKSIEIEAVGKRTPTGYVIEGRLRPTKNSPFQLASGTRFGMDFVVDDAGEAAMTRKAQMALHGSGSNSNDTSNFGRYYLMDTAATPVSNLIQNADLAQGEGQHVPQWQFTKGTENPVEAKKIVGDIQEIDGRRALRISISTEAQAHSWWAQTVPAKGDTTYAVSFRLKGNVEGEMKWLAGSAGVFFVGADGKWLGWHPIGNAGAPNGEWGTYKEKIVTPAGTETIGFRFEVLSNGVKGAATYFCTDMVVGESL